ncbi:helix-turn-helix domain-containing protein [Lysobacter fragariae]
MSALSLRIRKARTQASVSQGELARRVGVKRSAVTQWESPSGTTPSVEHLIHVAMQTGVNFEWLATGRGANRSEATQEAAVMVDDYAMDAHESKALAFLRNLPEGRKRIALQILEVLSR